MTFSLGVTSRRRLVGVHPDLVRVVARAIEITTVDFSVVCGVRSQEEQVRLYAKGRTTRDMIAAGIRDVPGEPDEAKVTWTLQSNHFINRRTGFGHAVDLAPFVGGRIVWKPEDLFDRIGLAMKAAAKEADVPVEWGGEWKRVIDRPHFELPKGYLG